MVQTNFTINTKLSPQQVELHNLIQNLLIVLSDKEKFIIQNRFALAKAKKMTLEEIGQHFGVTRERIRQIEKNALRKLERNAQNTNIIILTEFAKALLEKEGGVVTDERFKTLLLTILPNITSKEIHDLHLALTLDRDISFEPNTLKMHPYWRLNSINPNLIKKVNAIGLKLLQKTKQVMSLSQITQKVNEELKEKLTESSVTNILQTNKECKFTKEGLGLFSWRHIHPRTLRDKINYVFKREKKPLHFQKIADHIIAARFDKKKINVQAVHNELIRNADFVLIGRGIYALKEWGFQTGTVADVIEGILADAKPRSREEITKLVLEQRHVKSITVYLNLKNKPQFARVGRDNYTLSKLA